MGQRQCQNRGRRRMKAKPLGLLVISLSLFSVADGQTIDDLKSRLLRTHVSEDPSLSGPRAYKVDAEAAYDIEAVTIDLQLDGRRLPERATFEVTLTIRESTVERVAFTAPFFQVESVSMTDGICSTPIISRASIKSL